MILESCQGREFVKRWIISCIVTINNISNNKITLICDFTIDGYK